MFGLANADLAARRCCIATPNRLSTARDAVRCCATPSTTRATSNLTRADRIAGSLSVARAPSDRTCNASMVSASDSRAKSRESAARHRPSTLATLTADLMFTGMAPFCSDV